MVGGAAGAGRAILAMCVALLCLNSAAIARTAEAGPPPDPLVAECEIEKDAKSCAAMAIKHYEGRDVEQSHERARAFSAKACDFGEMMGCNLLGALMEDGLGGTKDMKGAADLYRKACANGYDGACYNVGTILYGNPARSPADMAEARRMFAMGCEAGIPDSCNDQGVMLKLGEGGEQDLPMARSLYARACEAGLADGCANSGYMLLAGEGGPKQPDAAAPLLETACRSGSMFACDNLGIVLLNGLAGERQPQEAQRLFRLACDGGQGNACLNLAGMLYNGVVGQADLVEARASFATGCENGSLDSCKLLAQMAFDGEGGASDKAMARQIYSELCEKFDVADTCVVFGVIAENGAGGPRDSVAALRAFERGCNLGDRDACLFREARQKQQSE